MRSLVPVPARSYFQSVQQTYTIPFSSLQTRHYNLRCEPLCLLYCQGTSCVAFVRYPAVAVHVLYALVLNVREVKKTASMVAYLAAAADRR